MKNTHFFATRRRRYPSRLCFPERLEDRRLLSVNTYTVDGAWRSNNVNGTLTGTLTVDTVTSVLTDLALIRRQGNMPNGSYDFSSLTDQTLTASGSGSRFEFITEQRNGYAVRMSWLMPGRDFIGYQGGAVEGFDFTGSFIFIQSGTGTLALKNQPPSDVRLSNTSVNENVPAGTLVGDLTAIDPDPNDTFTYTLADGEGDRDNGNFTIDGTALQTLSDIDYEARSSHSIRIRATDRGGLSVEKKFTISVTDVNEQPTAIHLRDRLLSIEENTSITERVKIADIGIVDDALGANTLQLSGPDEEHFELDGAGLYMKAGTSLDHEIKDSFSIVLIAVDLGLNEPATATLAVDLFVSDVNEAPIDLTLSRQDIDENAPPQAVVGRFRTSDPDADDVFTYSFATGSSDDDNGLFEIAGDELRLVSPLDYETRTGYAIRMRSTDSGGLSVEKVFSITLNDVNEPPRVVLRGSEIQTFRFGFRHINQYGADRYLYSRSGMRRYSEWQFPPITYWGPSQSGTTGSLVYRFDVGGVVTSANIKAFLPSWDHISGADRYGVGRGASSIEISSDGATWSPIRDGLEPNRLWGQDWTIDGPVGVPTAASHELWLRMRFFVEGVSSSYQYTNAQFGRSTSTQQDDVFRISLDYDTSNGGNSVTLDEGKQLTDPLKVATIVILDDALGTNVVSLAGPDSEWFETDGTDLYVRAGVDLDYEVKASYDVTVNVSDAGLPDSPPSAADFTVLINDLEETPVEISVAATAASIPDNVSLMERLKVADVLVENASPGDVALTLGGDDADSFEIEGLEVFLRSGTPLNFQDKPVYAAYVTNVDAASLEIDPPERQLIVLAVTKPETVIEVPEGTTTIDSIEHSGDHVIIKRGSGTVILDTENYHAGGIRTEAGELEVRDVRAFGSGPVIVGRHSAVRFSLGASIAKLHSVSIDDAALIDIRGGGVALSAGYYDEAALRRALVAGRGDGSWNGTSGLTSTQNTGEQLGLAGVATSNVVVGLGYYVDLAGGITVKQTLVGDANLDGAVDFDDVLSIFPNYNQPGSFRWQDGDFNYDGKVDFDDILEMFPNYGRERLFGAFGLEFSGNGTSSRESSVGPEPPANSARTVTVLTRSGEITDGHGIVNRNLCSPHWKWQLVVSWIAPTVTQTPLTVSSDERIHWPVGVCSKVACRMSSSGSSSWISALEPWRPIVENR